MRIIACLFVAILFWSCNKPYVKKPDTLLSKSEMVDILTDLYITQQLVNATPSQGNTVILDVAKNAVYILEQHQTTPKIFEDSYKYYFTENEVYSEILDDVKKELESRLSEEERNRLKEMNNQTSETIQ